MHDFFKSRLHYFYKSNMDSKKGNVRIYACPTKVAKSAVVVVGVKARGCYWTLHGLACGNPKCADMAYSTALLGALYKTVEMRMMGTLADELSSQITKLDCSYQNGEFIITAVCTSSFTAVRKTACNILKWMNPARVYPAYKECLKRLADVSEEKLSPDKKIFVGVANAFAKAAKSGVSVFVGGKVNLKKEHMEKLVEACAAKCTCDSIKGDSVAPPEKAGHHPAACMHLSASGVEAMLVKKYLETSLNASVHAAEGLVLVSNRHATAVKKLGTQDRVKRHVGTKYAKFKDGVAPALAFVSALNCVGNTKELESYSKKSPKGADLVASITSSFKSLK